MLMSTPTSWAQLRSDKRKRILSTITLLPSFAMDESGVDERVRFNAHAEALFCSEFRLKAIKVQGQERANISTRCSVGEPDVAGDE